MDLVGCDPQTLAAHLERTLPPGVALKDISAAGLHVDHIRPICTFDLADPEQQKAAFHYTNLQLLPASENLAKPRGTWKP